MSTEPVRVERRAAQRFEFHLPVIVRVHGDDREAAGLIQDLSAGGALLYTDFPLTTGNDVELTFVMPSEVTLAESMRVCCHGKVLRVVPSTVGSQSGIAVHFVGYEFLPDIAGLSASDGFDRAPQLHGHGHD